MPHVTDSVDSTSLSASRDEAIWESYAEAAWLFARGATVATASRITLVVGPWLSLMNQGRAITDGDAPWVKVALNYLTPFLVASLGYLAARRRRNVERLAARLGDSQAPPEGGV